MWHEAPRARSLYSKGFISTNLATCAGLPLEKLVLFRSTTNQIRLGMLYNGVREIC